MERCAGNAALHVTRDHRVCGQVDGFSVMCYIIGCKLLTQLTELKPSTIVLSVNTVSC